MRENKLLFPLILTSLLFFYIYFPNNTKQNTAFVPAKVLSSTVWWEAAASFKSVACSEDAVTDKVTGPSTIGGHMYHYMYAIFLMPLRYQENAKMLEIGLGCGMNYGAGASAKLWRTVLPNVELWEADVNEACLKHHAGSLRELGVNTLHGDQSSNDTLKNWLTKSGGGFDAIIDDGSHRNSDIMKTFDILWPSVKPGGVYFIEDLHVGRATDAHNPNENYEDSKGKFIVSEIMQAWIEQKLIVYPPLKLYHGGPVRGNDGKFEEDHDSWEDHESNQRSILLRKLHPMPKDIAFVFCQAEACAVGKEPSYTENRQSCMNAEQSSGIDNYNS